MAGRTEGMGRWPANLVLECTCEETREGRVKGSGNPYGVTGSSYRKGNIFPNRDGPTVSYTDPDGKEAVRIHTDPNCPCAMLDAQSGELQRQGSIKKQPTKGVIFPMSDIKQKPETFCGDSGGASRFFYCAKAGRKERGNGNHPTVKPLTLMAWLCKLITPPSGLILDPFIGSGTTAVAARMGGFRCVGIDNNEEYLAHAAERLRLGDKGLAEVAQARRAGAEQGRFDA